MTDHSAAMTTARATIVSLRLQGLTLAAMVHRGTLTGSEAARIVRDAASYLPAETNNPQIEALYQDALQQIAADLEGSRPQSPTGAQKRARQQLS